MADDRAMGPARSSSLVRAGALDAVLTYVGSLDGQLDRLVALGLCLAQGFLLCRPLPPEEPEALLRAWSTAAC